MLLDLLPLEEVRAVSADIVSYYTLGDVEAVGASVSADITSRFWLADVEVVADAIGAPILSVSELGANAQGGHLAEGGPYDHEIGWRRRPPRVPERIPVHVQVQPTVVEIEVPEPELEPVAAIDNRTAIAALYAAGAIDEDQFTALMAA